MNEGEEGAISKADSMDENQPRVFISYSHDSEEHGYWVLKMAERLVSCGIDVKLDQWDLGPGDDVVKYMCQSVSEVDRVLMICTAAYVRKADDGKGGVGYEAMVVDSELVRDQGTNKFIPVIRQQPVQPTVPKSVGTRLYVNLSHGPDFENQFEKLVREIHQTPMARKPTLGKNPYTAISSIVSITGSATSAQVGAVNVQIEDAESVYLRGVEVAKSGDFSTWRELVRKVKQPLSMRLNAWRKQYDGAISMEISALPALVLGATTIYSPLMALALAGVESGQPKFNNQIAILDELPRPKEWNRSGLVVVGDLPDALVFTYQALHGATCLEIGELSLAIALSRARIIPDNRYDGVIVHNDNEFIARPQSFNHSSNMAWQFLVSLAENWHWLNRIFGSAEDYRSSLTAYYMALNVQELATLIAGGRSLELDRADWRPTIPVEWMMMPSETGQSAYRKFTQTKSQVVNIWRSVGVSDRTMATAWIKWMEHSQQWISQLSRFHRSGRSPHATLFEDLRPED